jgi:serine/threonine-protein kinase RsbW
MVEMLEVTSLVTPEGRLDFAAATHFEARLSEALDVAGADGLALIVDCASLEYVSSAGLRTFLVTARAAEKAGVLFALAALTPAVREVFELSGFDRMIPLHTDRKTALEHAAAHGSRKARMVVPSETAQLPALTRFLQEFWAAAALPAESAQAFEVALEESFVNIAMHGAPAGRARVEVSLHLAGGQLALTVEDDGPAFDPLSVAPPNVHARLEERPVGGQGIHLVRQMMDQVSYRRVGKRNQLRMSKRIGS